MPARPRSTPSRLTAKKRKRPADSAVASEEVSAPPARPQGPRLLSAASVVLTYGSTRALNGASVDVHAGEVVALMGKSGSGKSSLLYCLAGIVAPDSGRVMYKGAELSTLDDDGRSLLRRRDFGFVFQFGELVPELTLAENIALPLQLSKVPRGELRARVQRILNGLGIEQEADRRPAQVSGGQAQRAAVGRALVHRPSVVFADEPTGSLDADNSERVLGQFVDLARDTGAAVVIVTHEEPVAAVADRVLHVVDGVVVGTA